MLLVVIADSSLRLRVHRYTKQKTEVPGVLETGPGSMDFWGVAAGVPRQGG